VAGPQLIGPFHFLFEFEVVVMAVSLYANKGFCLIDSFDHGLISSYNLVAFN
jgi:hypothetical protein